MMSQDMLDAAKGLRVVHLPVYRDNPYQELLMHQLGDFGVDVIDGGGGGNFVRTALFKWKADILHFHWLHPYMIRESSMGTVIRATRFLAEVACLRRAGARVVWTVHNLKNHDNQHVALEAWFTRAFARLVHRFIVHCEAAGALVAERFRVIPDRITVVPHGNYMDRYRNTMSRAESRHLLGIPEADFVYLFLGRVQPYKGIEELISASSELHGSRLIIAGSADPQYERKLRAQLKPGQPVTFHFNFVPDAEVQRYMNASDIVVLPYRDILTSSGLVLAMSFGKACIAPMSGCIPELLGSGGFLYEAGDAKGLAQAMVNAKDQRHSLAAMGRANRLKAAEWTWSESAERTAMVYNLAMAPALNRKKLATAR